MDKKTIKSFEKIIDYKFKNKDLLIHALTHKTYAYEATEPIEFNERLELLGDSILGFVVVEQLYKTNKYFSEGELTRRRAAFVNNKLLAKKAKEMKRKSRISHLGQVTWNTGLTKEISEGVKRIAESKIGKKRSEEVCKNISLGKAGKPNSKLIINSLNCFSIFIERLGK